MRRVSYHQTIFDLLDLPTPPLSPRSVAAIAEAEQRAGRPLPRAIRDWFAREGTVRFDGGTPSEGTLWHEYTNSDEPVSLATLLQYFERPDEFAEEADGSEETGLLRLMDENQGVCTWYARPAGDDPIVLNDTEGEWSELPPFSLFLREWIWAFYCEDFTPLSMDHYAIGKENTHPKPFRHGLWLASTMTPLSPPLHDALLETLREGARHELEDGVVQLDFEKSEGTRLRITTDRYEEPDGVASLWFSAPTAAGLVDLVRTAKRVLPFGELTSDSNQARKVLRSL